ncbi:HNH/endonuclease VII fold putative polymorphic toxin [Burkholderia gladioli]|uniref:HNH/endonuclease VII fold putative polymorphic toxin n=1 Tax=Burkholderia gladioli TaxID=28095 RepID=UPI003453D96F
MRTLTSEVTRSRGTSTNIQSRPPGGGTQTVIIRDDADGHYFGEGNTQNRGPYFNDPAGSHYDY